MLEMQMILDRLRIRGLRPIGLDIGYNSIRMIQLAAHAGQVSLVASAETNIDAGIRDDHQARKRFTISAIQQMITQGSFVGKKVVSCLSNEKLRITSLRMDQAEDCEIELALRREVVQRFGIDPDNDEVDYVHAGSVKHGDEVKNEFIVFAADAQTVRDHIDMLESAQLRPVSIDTVPSALFRSFERSMRRRIDREHTAVFVDIGSLFTTVVFGRNGEISFVKQIPIAGKEFNEHIAAKLGITANEAQTLRSDFQRPATVDNPAETGTQSQAATCVIDTQTRQILIDVVTTVAEKLAKEISLCFRYYTVTFRGRRVRRAIFSGGTVHETILLNVLRRQLAVDIEVAEPFKGFDLSANTGMCFDNDRRDSLCEWAVAVGLGLKGVSSKNREGDEHERN